jgi:hypothetical protein
MTGIAVPRPNQAPPLATRPTAAAARRSPDPTPPLAARPTRRSPDPPLARPDAAARLSRHASIRAIAQSASRNRAIRVAQSRNRASRIM